MSLARIAAFVLLGSLVASTASAMFGSAWPRSIALGLLSVVFESSTPKTGLRVASPPPPRVEAPAPSAAPVSVAPAPDLVTPPSPARPREKKVTSDPVAPLLDAWTALRDQDDPRAALEHLAQYERASRHGALAEEALALRIEALTRLDDERAVDAAKRYLDRYPDGRYRAPAKDALDRFSLK